MHTRPLPSPLSPPQVQLPLQDSEVDARGYDDERGEVGGFGSAHGKVGFPPWGARFGRVCVCILGW